MNIVLASIHPQPLSGQTAGFNGLARELRRLGHDVTAVSAAQPGTTPEIGSDLHGGSGGWIGARAARMAGALRQVVRVAGGADLVQLNLPTPAFAPLGEIIQSLVHAPVMQGFEAHLADVRWVCRRALFRDPAFYAPRLLVNNALLARCPPHRSARYFVSSRYAEAELVRLGFPRRSVCVLPNVLDSGRLAHVSRGDARRMLGLPDGPLVAYVGHYHHVKGVSVLIDAFERLSRSHPECRLVLAWSGLGDPKPVERQLRQSRIADRVLRLGRVPVGALLSAADVLVLPFLSNMGQSAYPALVLEALTVGIPLVTSDLPDLHELLAGASAASLVAPGDAEGLAAEVGRLLADEGAARAMVSAQRELARRELDPQRITQRYIEICREVLDERVPTARLRKRQGA